MKKYRFLLITLFSVSLYPGEETGPLQDIDLSKESENEDEENAERRNSVGEIIKRSPDLKKLVEQTDKLKNSACEFKIHKPRKSCWKQWLCCCCCLD